jgi:segregation and condensation protein B
METDQIQRIIEGALLASDGPLTVANLVKLFAPGELDEEGGSQQVRTALKNLQTESETRGVELKRVASGYRYQVRQELSSWVSRLWDEKPPRYTRALLETLALVAYKQPVTRGDIEQVRGVSVSQSIMRTLIEREWIRVVGQREVPGRPSLYGTTKAFLDYFNLKSLDELPPLAEIRALIEPALVNEEVAEVSTDLTSTEQAEGAGEVSEVDQVEVAASDTETESSITAHVDMPADEDDVASESPAVTAEVVQLHTGGGQPTS